MSKPSIWQIFIAFLKLGCTSFGGPIAHLGFFYESLIKQRQWLTEEEYNSLTSLCHFLPGPSSSQVGLGIGYKLQSWPGAVAAWFGFTLPSALLMTLAAIGVITYANLFLNDLIHYLKIIAVAVVIHAILQMGYSLLPRWPHRLMCLGSCLLIFIGQSLITAIWVQYIVLASAGIVSALILKTDQPSLVIHQRKGDTYPTYYKKMVIGVLLFTGMLVLMPVLERFVNLPLLSLFDSLYRTGATVFGGGHVVLPLMQQEVISRSAITPDLFLTGYSLAQAVPGPLFTLASYIGSLWLEQSPVAGAIIATVAIFLPSFILVPTFIPVWQQLQHYNVSRRVLAGFNAAVIGLLMTALYDPLIITTIYTWADIAAVCAVLAYIYILKWPIWILVLATVLIGVLFSI